MKRLIAILLVLALLPVPVTLAAQTETVVEDDVIPTRAYEAVNEDVWADIVALESSEIHAKRGKNATQEDYAALADEVEEIVTASSTYVEGTLNRNGDFISWETTEGVTCGYSPDLRKRVNNAAPTTSYTVSEEDDDSGIVSLSATTKNGPGKAHVALIQPYWEIDDNFTRQYYNEAVNLANSMGGGGTHYYDKGANIDNIADAIEKSSVVIFDSHGTTDYSNGDDCTSRANTSYLCLQTGSGITSADQKAVSGRYGTYYHAYYAGYNVYDYSMKYYCVDGTAIANHMDQNASNSLVWMAICLGMATDGMCTPLRNKGVGVVYGYSQSVTFGGDYLFEEAFFDNLLNGYSVGDSISRMKNSWGEWDCSSKICNYYGWSGAYYSASTARNNYAAFPIVVSAEDAYPGKGNVDYTQKVYSSWKLHGGYTCSHSSLSSFHQDATCTDAGFDRKVCNLCGAVVSETILPALGHNYSATVTTPATETTDGVAYYYCENCGDAYTGSYCPCYDYKDLNRGAWYHDGVHFVLFHGLMNGTGRGNFEPDYTMSRAMLVTVLYRMAGSPATSGKNPFTDVADGQWFTQPIIWASENGVVNGIGGGKFAPDENVTRQQMAVIFYRYASMVGLDTSASVELTSFPDGNAVPKWSRDALKWAVAVGLVTGTRENGQTLLLPEGNATRAQAATILMRFSKLEPAAPEISFDRTAVYGDGVYIVGKDIPAGYYYGTRASQSGYLQISVYTDAYCTTQVLNDQMRNNDFFNVAEGQCVIVNNGSISLEENFPYPVLTPTNGIYPEGVYRVGIDLPVGKYVAKTYNNDNCTVFLYTDGWKNNLISTSTATSSQHINITLGSKGILLIVQNGTFYAVDGF